MPCVHTVQLGIQIISGNKLYLLQLTAFQYLFICIRKYVYEYGVLYNNLVTSSAKISKYIYLLLNSSLQWLLILHMFIWMYQINCWLFYIHFSSRSGCEHEREVLTFYTCIYICIYFFFKLLNAVDFQLVKLITYFWFLLVLLLSPSASNRFNGS